MIRLAILFLLLLAPARAQTPVTVTGPVTPGNCTKFFSTTQIQDAGATCGSGGGGGGANPTATAGPNAINGVATTFMRSDAAPAVQLGSSSIFGIIEGDGSTVTISAGIIACTTATATQIGCGKPDNSTIKATAGTWAAQSLTFGGQSVAPGASAMMQGNGAKVQASTGSTTTNDCVKFDANGNTVDAGVTCGAVSTTIVPAQGRLTLASGVPVMSATSCSGSPCTAQGTVYYDCYSGAFVPYYNGVSDTLDTIASCEVSDALPTSGTGVANASDVFDLWWVHGGTNRLCHATNGSGAGWSGDTGGSTTARGTGYSQLNRSARGYVTNANTIAHCYNGATDYGSVTANEATYLGTFATTGSAGKVSFTFGTAASGGGAAVFGLWNYYGRVNVASTVTDNGSSNYTYSSATIRQARASSGNQASGVFGVAEDGIIATYNVQFIVGAALGATLYEGVGLDSTSTFFCNPTRFSSPLSSGIAGGLPHACTIPAQVGIHVISANEAADGMTASDFNTSSLNGLSVNFRM